ncbi:glycosyltransferase family 2 protein [Candidatus Gottesmanbacteria bacterium]|nr:glycosyltransferase family 2 protein [Candidatus Gottesmanbacteria bacterium]
MISAIVHTYNEEKNIERCLSSLHWVDEIVLIDMGSTDNTCIIAKNFKARIYSHPYTGFVEPARNFGLEKTKGDWIIIVDADEEVSKGLAHYLLGEVQKPSSDYYRIARKNIIFGRWVKHAGWWPDYQIRFFKKGSVAWTEKIHGIPLTYGTGTELDAAENLSLIHYHYQNIEQYIERLNRYTTISAKNLFVANQRFSTKLLFEMPTREFINRFFAWEGYKDGIHGMALSLLQAFSELVVYLKLWELENFREEKITLAETEELFIKENKITRYWFLNELLKQPHNFWNGFVFRLKRKLLQYG